MLLGLLLCIVVLVAAVQIVGAFVPAYMGALVHGRAPSQLGLEPAELRPLLQRVLDYSFGRSTELQFTMPESSLRAGEPAFGQRELAHMVDVRELLRLGRLLVAAGLVLVLLLLVWPAALRRPCAPCALDRAFWGASLQWGGFWGLTLLATVGGAALLDFGLAFERFHRILFRNDLWQLPADSLLILLLPEWQFARLAALSGLAAGLAFLLLIWGGWYLLGASGGRR